MAEERHLEHAVEDSEPESAPPPSLPLELLACHLCRRHPCECAELERRVWENSRRLEASFDEPD